MFEWDEGEKQWMAAHHPFTSPHEEDMKLLEARIEWVKDPQSPLSTVHALAWCICCLTSFYMNRQITDIPLIKNLIPFLLVIYNTIWL